MNFWSKPINFVLIYLSNLTVGEESISKPWAVSVEIVNCYVSLTGWKLGWAYGPSNLIRNLQIAHQNCTYMCQTPEQEAVGSALEVEIELLGSEESHFHKLTKELVGKRDEMVKAIRDVGMIPVVPEGGYFILVDWTPIGNENNITIFLHMHDS